MENYQMITKEDALRLSPSEFRLKYNDAVETIWYLQHKIQELTSENEVLLRSLL